MQIKTDLYSKNVIRSKTHTEKRVQKQKTNSLNPPNNIESPLILLGTHYKDLLT